MRNRELRPQSHFGALLFCLVMLLVNFDAKAQDGAELISVSLPAGVQVMPRTIFTQTWTFQNTGTTTWTPGQTGYTLNLVGKDSLGAVPLTANAHPSWFKVVACIDSGDSVPPGAQATFTMSFIAPEAAGPVTDTFQLNGASGDAVGAQVSVQIVVLQAGSTNQYDRAKAVSYANNYVPIMCSDGYFWTNGCCNFDYGVGAPVPTNLVGDDCAHFVSCCIGSQPNQWGGGLKIASRVPPTYGEPGAQRIIYTNLISEGWAIEVHSLNEMAPGDVIGWNWEGETNTALIDHVTLYLGNGMCAAHANSRLDVPMSFYLAGTPTPAYHLIHIFDAPTIASSRVGNNLVLSWGTNWTGYALYSSASLATEATWTKVSKSPVKIGASNVMTNTISSGAAFYRLALP